ncbi:UNVERIFIED_ORG: 4-amino-4-deoxy-L-arabinose transferase-like glycosyltransferase [Xanthobacter viscosus]|uniref:Glycosyltransferase family 39 protein n=1 Tax=Xanthobacter autotrophicus TaxID=280 RepID=A0A6C1KKC5_XANAU|nr:glycosyltransferase family 39 protein [Xanthobacter autotrophicus]TLX44719.1 glycosyltransferase family 39 protein [Xanthobacter autotrophicus]
MSFLEIDRRPGAVADACAVILLAAVTVIAALTFSDYGLGWDDFTHSQYGDLLYNYFSSGLTQRKVFSFVNLYYYGGGFDLLAATLAKAMPFVDVFDIRRLLGALVGVGGFFIVWRTGRRLAGPWGGFAAMALLMICPLFYGHIFMNVKDAPFAVAVAGVLYATVRAFDEFPNPSPRTVTLFGLSLGLAIGTRVMGLMCGVYILAAIGFLAITEARHLGLKVALKRSLGFTGLLALGLPLAYFVLGILWPWGVAEPLNPLVALKYYSNFWEVPWREMFEGRPILVPDMPRSYVPTLFSVQMPELFLGLALAGAAGAVVSALFGKDTPAKRARLVLVVTAAFFPVLLTVTARPVVYNGIRHFVFVTPALALLGGIAAAWLWEKAQRLPRLARGAVAAAFLVGLAMPAAAFRNLHPYEYTYYNHMAGGIQGADSKFMLDYWGLAFKQATEELDEYVEQHRRSLPQGRKLRVAVCGPYFAAAAELGPRYETTYDSSNADFYLRLGEFYCADVKAPTLVKIEREGVTYATVFDVRGRPFPSVFAAGQ